MRHQGAASHMADMEWQRHEEGIRAGLNLFQVGETEAAQGPVASAQAECLWKHQMFQEQVSSWINFLPKGTTFPSTQTEQLLLD